MSSSNDLLADRRFAWAMALLAEDDVAAAADLLGQVTTMVPRWAPGWAALGDARERLGMADAARSAFTRAAALDPDGRLGIPLKIARLNGEVPAAMPAAYVAALFDDYAPRFDRHLVGGLHYRGPALLAEALAEAAPGRVFERALDLGCGTGLMGRALAGRTRHIEGIDLSSAMVAEARRTGLYAALKIASIEEVLAGVPPGAYELVTAADVLVYIGDLAPVMAGVRRALSADGLFAFTTQHDPGPDPFRLGADLRFAHSRRHIEDSALAAGLVLLRLEDVSTRTERGAAVPGLVALAAVEAAAASPRGVTRVQLDTTHMSASLDEAAGKAGSCAEHQHTHDA